MRTDVELSGPLSLADFPEAGRHGRESVLHQVATNSVIYSAGDIMFFSNRKEI